MFYMLMVTAADQEEAERISTELLNLKWIACANMVSAVRSMFWWQGQIDRSQEVLLMMKAPERHVDQIIEKVKAMHSYDVPEVIALPIAKGNPDYLRWIDESTT